MFSWRSTRAQKKGVLSREIKIIIISAIACFLAIAVITHNAHDSSWFYYATHAQPVMNWCGPWGAQVAALLFYLMGSSSLVVVAFLFYGIFLLGNGRTLRDEWDRIIGWLCLLIALPALSAAYSLDFLASSVPGGVCGQLSYQFFYQHLDMVGTYLLLYCLLMISTIIISRFSYIGLIQLLVHHITKSRINRWVMEPLGKSLQLVNTALCRVCNTIKYRIEKILTFNQVKDNDHFEPSVLDEDDSIDEKDYTFWQHYSSLNTMPHEHAHAIQPEVNVLHEAKCAPLGAQEPQPITTPHSPVPSSYTLPHLQLVVNNDDRHDGALMNELEKSALTLQEKLERFGVHGSVTAIKRGPVVTLFEYQPDIDTKLSKIIALEDDLALALQAMSIRIIAPIPGRSVVGFEVANKNRKGVFLSKLTQSAAHKESTAQLPIVLGEDTIGNPVIVDLAKMPHLLMAGSTGSGKSVALNAMLISLLCKMSPDQVRLILIDPKRLEFAPYADIAHLLFPIVTDPKQASLVLGWVVGHMEERYEKMAQMNARNLFDYRSLMRAQGAEHDMPFIIVIIDELADLMMTSGKEVEEQIARIAQMARAAGIHLIAATQRPSVDVITGLIKVNFPSRISFRVTSKIDSRTILDCNGADKLLGRGDMLFLDVGDATLKRVHGAYVSDKEIAQVVAHIKQERTVNYLDICLVADDRLDDVDADELFEEVCIFINQVDEISISLLQRKFRIGYNRSARIMDMLESRGRIMPSHGGKMRKVIH